MTRIQPWPRPVLAANWKMNLGPAEARQFMAAYLARPPARHAGSMIIFPPAVSLVAAREAAAARPGIQFGVQNIYWEDKGAFTGEISAPLARAAGATCVLVGHSERRHVFGETDEETGRKCEAAARAGLTPVLCVGETLGQREAGETEAVVLRQLRAGLARLTREQVAGALLAYEPVWAIGTGRTATPADASTTHAALRVAVGIMLARSQPRGARSCTAAASTPAMPLHFSRRPASTGFSWAARVSIRSRGRRSLRRDGG